MPAKKNNTANTALEALLHAAEMMLSARSDDMLTDEEWDGLAAAVAGGRKVQPRIPTEPGEMLATLRITKNDRSRLTGGRWVEGTIAGHRFEALVFPEHAESASYELGTSRISKFHLREQATGVAVACFDRGWDVMPTTTAAMRITDLLAAGLAETVYGK
ncbi:MAG TPA: hypothetical protein PKE29_01440 [Phycisphaerales bacterium]|nr:hypothetical protein [Phycisphaerales bacterium]